MDTTQLLLAAAATLGAAFVALMAIVPSVMEATAVRGGLAASPPAPRTRPSARGRHQGTAPLPG